MSYYGNVNIKGKCGMESDYEEMDIDSSDVKSETKKYQRPQNTVRIRNYRAAVVCLVLLCVLLLTAVIVLSVYIHKKSTQFQEDLAKQRDQLIQEKKELSESIGEMDGWIYYQSRFYFVSSEKKNWTESREYCTERGADLIIINNKEEQDFVKNMSVAAVYIGLTDIDEEGRWKWVDGSNMTSGFWASGGNIIEPSGGTRENCVVTVAVPRPEFANLVGWHDVACNKVFYWICEKRISQFTLP